nr:STT3 domain-containing protein [Candidatus Sigynarchaeota archaeon]
MPTTSQKIKKFFGEGWEKSRASMKIVPQNIILVIALVMIFALGVLIRLSPIFNNVFLIKEFDPWAQYKSTQYIVDNGLWEFLNWTDYQSWYPEGNPFMRMYIGLPLTNAIFYWILHGLGLPVTVYDVCFISPAFMGGVTCIVAYFLGKEILDKKTGLLGAFFLAFSPGYMQRTVAGFYDNETVGVFATLVALLFFIRAIKKGSIIDGVIGGFGFGYLTLSWGGYSYTSMLLPLCAIIMILVKKYSTRLLIAYSSVVGIGFAIHSMLRRITLDAFFRDSSLFIPLAVLVLLPFVEFFYRMKENNPARYRSFWRWVKKLIIPGILATGVILWAAAAAGLPVLSLPSRLLSILNPLLREQIALVASVGEHMPSPWSTFYYNTFIPLLFIVPGIYFAYKRGSDADIITIVVTITLYYFTGSMTRIIMLFAPIASIMGAYGISQILKAFGAISHKKAAPASRIRRREAKQGMDTSVSLVIFIFVGFLATTQVIQAADVSATQLPWSELVVGGQFHDWEEALTWMRTNLNSGTVIVSWWDYGYWSTILGNVTSVNDNATLNSTRIGFVGMGMMMNDELEAARVFRALGADYVLVYFGHLVSGLGGDEGKWPWMVKICNDQSKTFFNSSLYPELHTDYWYHANRTGENGDIKVFNYDDYINETSGLYKSRWFNSQLVRMMFYQEPLTTDKATTQLQYWAAREISGDGTSSYQPRKDDSGKLWTDYFNGANYFKFNCFSKAFFSSNSTVKIYKLDYTAIDSDFEVNNATIYDNGFGHVLVNNTGTTELNITSVSLGFTLGTGGFDAYPYEGTPEVQPNQTKAFWFDTKQANKTGYVLHVGDSLTAYVNASVNAVDSTYSFERTKEFIVQANKSVSIHVDRSLSTGKIPDIVEFEVSNTGNEAVMLGNVTVDGTVIQRNQIEPLNETYVIPVGTSRRFQVTAARPYDVGDIAKVNATMVEGISDLFTVTMSDGDAAIAFTNDFITLPESDLVYNNWFLKNQSLINFSQPEMTRYRSYLPVNLASSVAYTNGTIRVRVKNTGSMRLGLDEVRVNGSTYSGWIVEGGQSYFFNPGETRTIRINYGPLGLDRLQKIQVFAIDSHGNVVASDGGQIKTITGGEAIRILRSNQYTFAYTNETAFVAVKNVGSVPTTISTLNINSSADIAMTSSTIYLGNKNRVLGIQQALVINYSFTPAQVANFNATNYASLRVRSTTAKEDTVIVKATKNPVASLELRIDYVVSPETIKIRFKNNGTAGMDGNLTVGKVKLEVNGTVYWKTPLEFGTLIELGLDTILSESNQVLYWPGSNLVAGQKITITIYSAEGGEDTKTYTVT